MLRDTYGLLVYQDDALGMIRALTGLSVPESHRFYKRATKKVTDEQDRLLADEFRRLCAGRGVPAETVAEQWLLLTHFRRYTFCKSHAVSYALLAWQCVAAKARSPLQFWTAVLNNNRGVYPRRVYVEAVKRAGFRVLLPCVNRSAEAFLPEGDGVRTGLGAIAALPREVRRRVLDERRKDGPYRGLADFCRRVAPGPEALAALIRCGALDFTGRNRPTLFLEADLRARAEGRTGSQATTRALCSGRRKTTTRAAAAPTSSSCSASSRTRRCCRCSARSCPRTRCAASICRGTRAAAFASPDWSRRVGSCTRGRYCRRSSSPWRTSGG